MAEEPNSYLADGIAAFEAKHFAMAIQILSPLADGGEAEAQFRLAIIHQNGLGTVVNESRAFENMLNAAKQEHPLAMHSLGFMYLEGECATQDYALARHWFEKAAKKNMPGSMMALGMMYSEGQGVEQDAQKAQYWYDQANNV